MQHEQIARLLGVPPEELAEVPVTSISGARTLYKRMKAWDYSAIIETAMRECGVRTKEGARELLDAFLQWFSLIPETTSDHPLQMLRSVDRIWHAMILNTKFYREFCNEFVGHFVDHNPLDVTDADAPKKEYARHTLSRLRTVYGGRMSKALCKLRENVTCCYFQRCGHRQAAV